MVLYYTLGPLSHNCSNLANYLLEYIYSFDVAISPTIHLSYSPLRIVSLVSTLPFHLLVRVGSANSMTHLRKFCLALPRKVQITTCAGTWECRGGVRHNLDKCWSKF
jgi:hypothetical protein